MILDKELEKVLRKDLEEHEMFHCINLIYEYRTPHGILTNNIDIKKLSKIFKNSLKEKDKEYYSNPFHDYFLGKQKESGVKNTLIQFIHYHEVHMMDGGDSTNIYLIENFGKQKLNISKKYVEAMNSTAISYFIIIDNGDSIVTEETIDEFKNFRVKNKIPKNKVLFVSKNKPFKNTEWSYLNFDIFNSNTIHYIGENLNKVYKKDLV
tara:strand:- start:556 stop:1179 length:624 start_codon:yes stop_codon:yes gene_type:complete